MRLFAAARGAGSAALAMAALAGCAGLNASPRSPIARHEQAISGLEDLYSADAVRTCFTAPLAEQKPCRDTIVQALLTAIDLRYADYEVQFFDATRYGSFGTTVLNLGLTGAASVSSGGAARILAAIATGVTGAREAFDREVLAERTAAALLTVMRAERNLVGEEIRRGLRESAERYPLGVALSDLYAYFRAGTVPGALSGLTQAAGARAALARERLAEASGTAPPAAAATPGPGATAPAPGADAAQRQRSLERASGLPPRVAVAPQKTRAADCLRRLLEEGTLPERTANAGAVEAAMRALGIAGNALVFADGGAQADQERVLRRMGRRCD